MKKWQRVILIICGTLALLSDYIKEKRDVVFSEMNLSFSQVVTENVEIDEGISREEASEEINEQATQNTNNYVYEEYLGVIDIPKINLYKGFYSKTSNLNNVKFNLYVLPESTYPDTEKGNLIIAGHSGNYSNSYFANLYELIIDDTITIHYNNLKYIYKIVNIYYEKKTGMVRILRDKEKTTLTLITCTYNDDSSQTIYIAELIGTE